MFIARTNKSLMPGELCFAEGPVRLRTLLGSCVAVTLWHPRQKIGGMCHFMLPRRPYGVLGELSGRYGEDAVLMLLQEVLRRNTRPEQYIVRLFGGANMFHEQIASCADEGEPSASLCNSCHSIGCQNRIAALHEVRQAGFTLLEADLGGTQYRQVEIFMEDGITRVKKALPKLPTNPVLVMAS